MSRPTRTGAPPEIWVSTPEGDYEVMANRHTSYDVVMPAPKGAVLLVPDTCPTCDGSGEVHCEGGAMCNSHLDDLGSMLTCTKCAGRGYVWPDKLRQNLEWVLTANAPLMSQRMKDAIVVDLLDVLREVDDDE